MIKRSVSHLNYYQKMLLTYILTAMIFFSICYTILASYFFYHALRENQKAGALAVQQMQSSLDNQFASLENLYLRIRTDSDLVQALLCRTPYEVYRTSSTFTSYCAIYPGLLDVVVFDYKQNVVQCAFGESTPDEYFRKMLKADNYAACEKAVKTGQDHTLSGFYQVQLYSRNYSANVALYVINMSADRRLVFVIDQKSLLDPVEILVGDTGTDFSIADQNRNLLISYSINGGADHTISEDTGLTYKWEDGLYTAEKDGQLNLVSHSQRSGFYYCVSTSAGSFRNPKILYLPLIVAAGTIGLSGIFVGILLAKRAYQPIQQLQDYVTGKSQGYGNSKKEDFAQIRAAFDQLRIHAVRSEQDRGLLRNSLLRVLTFSPFFYQHYPDFYRDAALLFPHEQIQVAAIHTTPELIAAEREEITASFFDGDVVVYPLETEKSLMLIINASDGEQVMEFLRHYGEALVWKDPEYMMGVSGMRPGAEEIWVASIQALTALEWCEANKEQVCYYKRQQNRASLALNRFYNLQPAFYQAVSDGKPAEAEKRLREILSVTPGRELRLFIYNSLLSQLVGFSSGDLKQSEAFLSAIQQNNTTTEQLVQQLLLVVEELCSVPTAEPDDFMKEIEAQITTNYGQPDFSIQALAQYFKVSTSYISKYMKKFTEKTVFTLIDEQRMAYAIRLLETTDLAVKDVVAKSGYVDVNNFTKKFKSATGYTPTLYRQLKQNGK